MDKYCSNCSWNDDGLCDRVGIFVDDEDQCDAWKNLNDSKIVQRS